MLTAIICAIIVGLLSVPFVNIMYIVISVIVSLIKNIGKDEFTWYGQPLNRSYAKTQAYDSFADMVKDGFFTHLGLCGIMFVLALIVCIYVQLRG